MKSDYLRVVLAKPFEKAVIVEIKNDLHTLQDIVGGPIEVFSMSDLNHVVGICNEEGKLRGLPLNRILIDDSDIEYDICCGPLIIASRADPDLASLTQPQAKIYRRLYSEPDFDKEGRNISI